MLVKARELHREETMTYRNQVRLAILNLLPSIVINIPGDLAEHLSPRISAVIPANLSDGMTVHLHMPMPTLAHLDQSFRSPLTTSTGEGIRKINGPQLNTQSATVE